MMNPADNQVIPHLCLMCSSPLVQPTEWNRMDDEHWEIAMRCPECFRTYHITVDQGGINDLAYKVEQGFEALLEVVETLDREVFREQCETFITAVRAGQIHPMDF